MNRVEKELKNLSKPTLDLPLYQSKLRRRLLQKFDRRSNPIFTMFLSRILPSGIALTLVLVIGSMYISKSPDIIAPVSAAEIINNTLQNVKNLNEIQLEEIMQKTGRSNEDHVINLLEEAKSAADLQIVEPKEMACSEAQTIANENSQLNGQIGENFVVIDENSPKGEYSDFVVLGDVDNCENAIHWKFSNDKPDQNLDLVYADGSQLTYLQYTKNGNLMILGIDEEGLPLTALSLDPNAKSQTIHLGDVQPGSMRIDMQ